MTDLHHILTVTVENIVERGSIQGRNFLANERHYPVAWTFEVAGIRAEFACNQRQQAGFAGAVAPADADAPAGVQAEADLLEQQQRAAAKGEIFES